MACRPNLGYPEDDTAANDDTGAIDSEDPDDTSNPDTSGPPDTSNPDTGPQGDCHPADPVNIAGWTRNYTITYRGKTGTEVQRGQGGGTYTSQMTAQTDSWNVTVRNGCNAQGQALQQGWEGSASLQTSSGGGGGLFPPEMCALIPDLCPAATSEGYTVRATPSAPRPYLPSMSNMRNGAQWSYTYDLAVVDTSGTNQFQPASVPTTGTYTAWGSSRIEPITIAGRTYQAFYLTNQYTQDWSTVGGSGGGMSNVDGYSELWYVEGLGLVKEKTTDLNDTSTIYVEKTLTSFTGLTPVQ